MSYDEWKLEDYLCRCCHSEGSFKNLSKGFNFGNEEEIYVDMLKYTLDIHIAPVLGALCTATYTICEPCILKLQEATTFKKQVLRCEEKFRDMYTRNFIKVAAPSDLEIKDEPPEENDDTQQDIPYMDSDEFHIKDDEHDKEDEEEELITKKVKHEGKKRSKKMPSKSKSQPKPKKPPKRGRPRKGDEVVANEKAEGNTLHDYHECFKIIENGESKIYVCRYCGLEYTDAERMTSHISDEHSSKCKERLTSNDNIVKVHDYIEVGPRFNVRLDKVLSYVCHVCSKEYPNENSLKLHKKNYHILKKCPDCDLKFTRRNLRMHQHESHGVQIPTCGVCGYKNWVTAKVIVHQRKVHMNEKNVSCDQCDMKFFDRISLGRHKIAHGTDRKFECSYCHKKYPRLNTLRLHEKIHTKVKDKICSICGQGFVQKHSLLLHLELEKVIKKLKRKNEIFVRTVFAARSYVCFTSRRFMAEEFVKQCRYIRRSSTNKRYERHGSLP